MLRQGSAGMPTARPSRRLLLAVCVVGAATLVAACGSTGPGSPASHSQTTGTGTTSGASHSRSITSTQTTSAQESLSQVVARTQTGVIRIEAVGCDTESIGTGFLIGPRLVATVEHVVAGATSIRLVRDGKTVAVGTVIGEDSARDMALVQASKAVRGYVFGFSTAAPTLGESVAALGFPYGLPLSLTQGVVSGTQRTIPIDGIQRRGLVQLDAPVNPGNSGGPVFTTSSGQVIGLIDLGATHAAGIAFAVSSRVADPLLTAWTIAPQTTPSPACASGPVVAGNRPAAATVGSRTSAVLNVLQRYEIAYSDHDVSGLARIFSPDVVRHGLASGGCAVAEGRAAVLGDYVSQFAEGTGTYQFVGLGPSEVSVHNATTDYVFTNYAITGGGSGWVDFALTDQSGGWLVSEIYATCS